MMSAEVETKMKPDRNTEKRNRSTERMLAGLSERKKAPLFVLFILMAVYLATSLLTGRVAQSQDRLMVFGKVLPVSSLAGVITSLSTICTILMVLFYGRLGYVCSMAALFVQMPSLLVTLVSQPVLTGLPGLFSNIVAILTITLIHVKDKRAEDFQTRLQERAVVDVLTQLPNRFGLTELVERLVEKKETFTLVSVDLNNFKSINDTMGHQTGNDVLVTLSNRWKEAAESGVTGTTDFVARQSGDEFSLVIRNYDSHEQVFRSIQHYREALEKTITLDDCDYHLEACFGYAEYPTDADNADALQTYADAAMYEAKRKGGGVRVRRFTKELLSFEHALEVERKVRTALERDLLFFHLQPQYDINHQLRGFEALARMKDPDDESRLISPAEFIPAAEKMGLVDRIDSGVFRKSAIFFGDLLRKMHSGGNLTLSVNVSVQHLMKNSFLDEVGKILEESRVPVHQIEIEITESIMIESAEKALQCITRLKEMGMKIAIDDFGTGYSSLSYLNRFPADLLKVDKSFVDKMNSSDSSRQYVAAIISIGHIMNLDVIAEGVEKPEQMDTLRNIGCDYIQGFIWGRPMPPEEIRKLVVA